MTRRPLKFFGSLLLISALSTQVGCGNGGGYGVFLSATPRITDAVLLMAGGPGAGSGGSSSGNSSGSSSGSSSSPSISPYSVPWPAGQSVGYCETGQTLAQAWMAAMNADQEICLLGGVEPAWHTNLVDGNWHYLATSSNPSSISVNGVPMTGPQIRVQATLTSDGHLATLHSTNCSLTGSGTGITQVPIADVTFIRQDPTVNNQSSLLVKTTNTQYFAYGVVDDNGNWITQKSLTMYGDVTNTVSGGPTLELKQATTVLQTANTLNISSWAGNYANGTIDFEAQLFASAALTGNSPTTYGLGDGAAQILVPIDNPTPPSNPFYLGAWLGSSETDVSSPASNSEVSAYYAAAVGANVSGLNGDSITVGYGNDAWDCTAPAGEPVLGFDDAALYDQVSTNCFNTYQNNAFVQQFIEYQCGLPPGFDPDH